MVRALGYSSTSFNPLRPGRLCRGRERWVQSWESEALPELFRVVVSGAEFSDDSARDARRGLTCAGVNIGAMVRSFFPGRTLLGFKEEGYIGELPDFVEQVDEDSFRAPRRGGAWFDPCQRWRAELHDPEQLSELIAGDRMDGLLVFGEGQSLTPEVEESLFLLTSQASDSAYPVERFQPLALVELMAFCEAVVCVHLDKHGPAIGVYTAAPIDLDAEVQMAAADVGILPVPFAIPPMLARWDRALQELRHNWMSTHDDDFPVPPADEPTRWSRRTKGNASGEE